MQSSIIDVKRRHFQRLDQSRTTQELISKHVNLYVFLFVNLYFFLSFFHFVFLFPSFLRFFLNISLSHRFNSIIIFVLWVPFEFHIFYFKFCSPQCAIVTQSSISHNQKIYGQENNFSEYLNTGHSFNKLILSAIQISICIADILSIIQING